MPFRRRTSIVVSSAVTLAAVVFGGASPAHALPPVTIPPAGQYSIVIPAEETPCGAFVLVVDDRTTARIFTRPDGTQRLHAAGQLSGVLTSVVTGRSLAVDFSGPVWITQTATTLTGGSLLWNPTLLALAHGRVVVPADGTAWRITGKQVDLCPLLVPTP